MATGDQQVITQIPYERVVHAPGSPSRDQILAQVERIVASDSFGHADRPRDFLRFLVRHALLGEPQRMDEYTLAVEVFGRKASFDARADPIVRVETGRLRRRIKQYYESEGSGDPVVIDLPARTYVPVFRIQGDAVPVRVLRPGVRILRSRWTVAAGVLAILCLAGILAGRSDASKTLTEIPPRKPWAQASTSSVPHRSVVVLPVVDLTGEKDHQSLCDNLTEEFIDHLGQVPGLRVVSRTSAYFYKNSGGDIRKIGAELGAGIALEAIVRKEHGLLHIHVRLVDTADGYQILSRTFEEGPGGASEDAVARNIVSSLVKDLRLEPHPL